MTIAGLRHVRHTLPTRSDQHDAAHAADHDGGKGTAPHLVPAVRSEDQAGHAGEPDITETQVSEPSQQEVASDQGGRRGGLHLVGARQAVPLPRDRAGWTAELQAGRWFLLWLVAGTVVMAMTAAVLGRQAAYPIAEHLLPADRFVTVLDSVSGGVEEPFFLAFTVAVLRRAGFGWPAVVGTSIGLRWAFHISYGLPSVGLVVWAGGAVMVYRLTGRIIGVLLAHLLWDTMAASFLVGWQPVGVTCGVLLLAVLILPALRGPKGGAATAGA